MKKLRIVFVVLMLLVSTLSVFAACSTDTGGTVAITGIADNSTFSLNSTDFTVNVSVTSGIDKFDVNDIMVGPGVTLAVYSDKACTSPVSALTLNQGKNTFYVKCSAQNVSTVWTLVVDKLSAENDATIISGVTLDSFKTGYVVGDTVGTAKLKVTYKDGAYVVVDATVSGFDATTAGSKKVVLSYLTYQVEATITVTAPTVKTVASIALSTIPSQFLVGAPLPSANVTVTYSDSTTALVPMTASMVSGFDTTAATEEEATATVTLEGCTATFKYTVCEPLPTIQSIAAPTFATGFVVDAPFPTAKIVVTYSDNAVENVTMTAAMVTGFDTSEAKTNATATITYGGKTATFTYSVYSEDAEVESIAVSPTTLSLMVGDPMPALSLTVTYADESTAVVAVTPEMIVGFNTAYEMESGTAIVTFGGKVAQVAYSVAAIPVNLVSIVVPAINTQLEIGAELPFDEVKLVYDNDSTEMIDVSQLTITGFDTSASVIDAEATVTYNDVSAVFKYTVKNEEATLVTVEAPVVGELFVGDDMPFDTVVLVYSDGSKETVSADGLVTGFSTEEAGVNKKATVAVYGITPVSFYYTVKALPVTLERVVLSSEEDSFGLYVGDPLPEITMLALYSDGSIQRIPVTKDMITGFSTEAACLNGVATITYESFSVEVKYLVATPPRKVVSISAIPFDGPFAIDAQLSFLTINLVFDDESTDTIIIDSSFVSGFDSSAVVTDKKATVTFGSATCELTYSVAAIVETAPKSCPSDWADYAKFEQIEELLIDTLDNVDNQILGGSFDLSSSIDLDAEVIEMLNWAFYRAKLTVAELTAFIEIFNGFAEGITTVDLSNGPLPAVVAALTSVDDITALQALVTGLSEFESYKKIVNAVYEASYLNILIDENTPSSEREPNSAEPYAAYLEGIDNADLQAFFIALEENKAATSYKNSSTDMEDVLSLIVCVEELYDILMTEDAAQVITPIKELADMFAALEPETITAVFTAAFGLVGEFSSETSLSEITIDDAILVVNSLGSVIATVAERDYGMLYRLCEDVLASSLITYALGSDFGFLGIDTEDIVSINLTPLLGLIGNTLATLTADSLRDVLLDCEAYFMNEEATELDLAAFVLGLDKLLFAQYNSLTVEAQAEFTAMLSGFDKVLNSNTEITPATDAFNVLKRASKLDPDTVDETIISAYMAEIEVLLDSIDFSAGEEDEKPYFETRDSEATFIACDEDTTAEDVRYEILRGLAYNDGDGNSYSLGYSYMPEELIEFIDNIKIYGYNFKKLPTGKFTIAVASGDCVILMDIFLYSEEELKDALIIKSDVSLEFAISPEVNGTFVSARIYPYLYLAFEGVRGSVYYDLPNYTIYDKDLLIGFDDSAVIEDAYCFVELQDAIFGTIYVACDYSIEEGSTDYYLDEEYNDVDTIFVEIDTDLENTYFDGYKLINQDGSGDYEYLSFFEVFPMFDTSKEGTILLDAVILDTPVSVTAVIYDNDNVKPYKVHYTGGDYVTLDYEFSASEFMITLNDGSYYYNYPFELTGFNPEQTGKQTITVTVTYEESPIECEFEVTVVDPDAPIISNIRFEFDSADGYIPQNGLPDGHIEVDYFPYPLSDAETSLELDNPEVEITCDSTVIAEDVSFTISYQNVTRTYYYTVLAYEDMPADADAFCTEFLDSLDTLLANLNYPSEELSDVFTVSLFRNMELTNKDTAAVLEAINSINENLVLTSEGAPELKKELYAVLYANCTEANFAVLLPNLRVISNVLISGLQNVNLGYAMSLTQGCFPIIKEMLSDVVFEDAPTALTLCKKYLVVKDSIDYYNSEAIPAEEVEGELIKIKTNVVDIARILGGYVEAMKAYDFVAYGEEYASYNYGISSKIAQLGPYACTFAANILAELTVDDLPSDLFLIAPTYEIEIDGTALEIQDGDVLRAQTIAALQFEYTIIQKIQAEMNKLSEDEQASVRSVVESLRYYYGIDIFESMDNLKDVMERYDCDLSAVSAEDEHALFSYGLNSYAVTLYEGAVLNEVELNAVFAEDLLFVFYDNNTEELIAFSSAYCQVENFSTMEAGTFTGVVTYCDIRDSFQYIVVDNASLT